MPCCEPRGERLRQARVPDLRLRPLDRIRDSAERCPPALVVNQEPRGARVAVAGLADRAGVEEPPRARRGRRSVPAGARPPSTRVAVDTASASATWLWPTSTSGAGVAASAARRRPSREHVFPDRVARAAVEELDAGARAAAARATRGTRAAASSSTPRVQRGRRGRLAGEVVERDLADHDEVVVADEADVGPLADERDSTRSARPVADEVAEAPELVGAGPASTSASTASSACRFAWMSEMTATRKPARNSRGGLPAGSGSPSP